MPCNIWTLLPWGLITGDNGRGLCFSIWWQCGKLSQFTVYFVGRLLPVSFRVTSLVLGQSYDCPSTSEATLNDRGKCIRKIHGKWWYNHNKTKHNKMVVIYYGIYYSVLGINSSPPGQNGCHFADDIFRCIFVNEKFCILIKISLKFVSYSPIDNNPALVEIMAWRWNGD